MTDEQIISDLQSASEWFTEHGRNTNTAIIGICDRAVDLINRQKAEIERLKSDVSVSRDAYMSMTDRYYFEKEKVARAKQKCIDIAKALKTAKSEAITEYQEEVKKRCIEGGIYPVIVKKIMEDVRKEMI